MRTRSCSAFAFVVAASLASACATAGDDGGRSVSPESLRGVTWEWTGTETPGRVIEVAAPGRYTIRFKADGEARIRYDCNHGGGIYEISEGRLYFVEPLTYTRVKCGQGSHGFFYRQQLSVVRSFFTQRGKLYLELPDDSGTMRFRRAGND